MPSRCSDRCWFYIYIYQNEQKKWCLEKPGHDFWHEILSLWVKDNLPPFMAGVFSGSTDADCRLSVKNRPEASSPWRCTHPRLLPPQEPASPETLHAGCSGHSAQKLQVAHAHMFLSFGSTHSFPVSNSIWLFSLSSAVTPVMVDAVLAELPPLISESDMHVSQMALSFLSTLAVTHPSSLGQLSGGNILQQLIALVRSPLLQGGALAAMLDFYQVHQKHLKLTQPALLSKYTEVQLLRII